MLKNNLSSCCHIKDLIEPCINNLETLYESKCEYVTGISSGFRELDRQNYRLKNSEIVILAGRPSMGKTDLALNIALNIAYESHIPVLYFSLESSKELLVNRLLAITSRVDKMKFRSAFLNDTDWKKIKLASELLENSPIFIDECFSSNIEYIIEKSIEAKLNNGIGLIIIDSLQLISFNRGKINYANRIDESAEITRKLKLLARKLDIPIILLSGISRKLESRKDKRPILSDLPEHIAYIADVILFLYRRWYYERNAEYKESAELFISKNRSGTIGQAFLGYDSYTGRFYNDEKCLYDKIS